LQKVNEHKICQSHLTLSQVAADVNNPPILIDWHPTWELTHLSGKSTIRS